MLGEVKKRKDHLDTGGFSQMKISRGVPTGRLPIPGKYFWRNRSFSKSKKQSHHPLRSGVMLYLSIYLVGKFSLSSCVISPTQR